jgi:hypothetical protein
MSATRWLSIFKDAVVQEEAEGKEALFVEEMTMARQASYHSGACLLSLAFLLLVFFASLVDFFVSCKQLWSKRHLKEEALKEVESE